MNSRAKYNQLRWCTFAEIAQHTCMLVCNIHTNKMAHAAYVQTYKWTEENATTWFNLRKQTRKLLHGSLEVLKFINMYVTVFYRTETKYEYTF